MASRRRDSTRGSREAQGAQKHPLQLRLLWVDDNERQRSFYRRRLEEVYPDLAHRWEIIECDCLSEAFETRHGERSAGRNAVPLRMVDAVLVDHYLIDKPGGTPDKTWGEELIVRVRSYRERHGVRIRIVLYSGVDFPPPYVRDIVDRTIPADVGVLGRRLKDCLENWYQEFQVQLQRLEKAIDDLNELNEQPVEITHQEKIECCRKALSVEQLEVLLRFNWEDVMRGSQGFIELVDRSCRSLQDHDDLLWEDEEGKWWLGRKEARGVHPLAFSLQERQFLRSLMINDGKECTKEQLMDYIWGWGTGNEQGLQALVKNVRRKLPDGGERWVVTCRGIGYMGLSRGTGGLLQSAEVANERERNH